MKRVVLITLCIILICAAMFYFISLPHNVSDLAAKGGILDLTEEKGRDADGGGKSGVRDSDGTIYALDGEWEFYYGQLLTPEDFASQAPEGRSLIRVPSSWDEEGWPLYGVATYRLTILADEGDFMMMIPEILDSAVIWIDGRKVFEAGKPAGTRAEFRSGVRNAFVHVPFEDGRAEVIVQAANYNWYVSGLYYSLTLSDDWVLLGGALSRRLMLMFVIGILTAMGLYHAVLFVYRRREKVYLAFSLACLFFSLRLLLATNSIADLLLPGGIGPGLTKAFIILLALHSGAIIFFAHTVFAIAMKSRFRRAVYAAVFLIVVFSAILELTPWTLALIMIPMMWSTLSAARSQLLRDNPYNMLFFIALIVYNVWYPLNALALDDALFVPTIAPNLFLALSQCVMLSVSYVEAKRQFDELAERNNLLDRLARMKNEFFQNMSHELKTPLTVISTDILNAADLLDFDMDKEEMRVSLEHAQHEIIRMARIVDGMMKYSSMNDNRQDAEPLDIASFLREGAENYRALLDRNGNSLTYSIPKGLPQIAGSSDALLHVLSNLLSNANRHTRNGNIHISAYEDGSGAIAVTVCDTGRGISPELLPHVQERGVSDGGTGLGLSICKEIIEACNGHLEINSEPEKGTCVTFTLPVCDGKGYENDRRRVHTVGGGRRDRAGQQQKNT